MEICKLVVQQIGYLHLIWEDSELLFEFGLLT